MARNKFGCICDICGKYSKYSNQFYRLILPTYQSKMNNSTQSLDYCFDCYDFLKTALANIYNIKDNIKIYREIIEYLLDCLEYEHLDCTREIKDEIKEKWGLDL